MRSFTSHSSHIWPGYVPPENEELLSSWLFRMSREHKMKAFSFTSYYFKTSQIWTRDMDKYIPDEITDIIISCTPLCRNDIVRMQLNSYRDIIFEGDLSTVFTQGISNLGIYHRKRKRKGLVCCPGCLGKKEYFKKSWRLLSSLVCIECNSHLIDCCPECGEGICFHRLGMKSKSLYLEYPLYLCWNCHFDLRNSKTEVPFNSLLSDYQKFIDDTIHKGYNKHSQYSFLFFHVLFLILRKCGTSSNSWNRIRNAFVEEFNTNHPELFKRNQFSTIDFRRQILPMVYGLLEDWPEQFIRFCKGHSLRYSDFSKEKADLPFWLYRVFKESF